MVQKAGTRTDLGNNITEVDTGVTGTSRAYTISRLQKQHPDLYQEVVDGKLAKHRRPTSEEHEGKGDAVTFTKGNANDYWQARIQRDCPEELDAIKSGEKGITPARSNRSSSDQFFWISRHASRISLFVGSRSGPTSRLMRRSFSSSGISEERTRCTPSLVA